MSPPPPLPRPLPPPATESPPSALPPPRGEGVSGSGLLRLSHVTSTAAAKLVIPLPGLLLHGRLFLRHIFLIRFYLLDGGFDRQRYSSVLFVDAQNLHRHFLAFL